MPLFVDYLIVLNLNTYLKIMIHIVCGIDDKFVMPCGVLMSSVFENNKNEQIEFHVITAGLKNESTNSLQKIADNYNQRLSFVVVDEVVLKIVPQTRI